MNIKKVVKDLISRQGIKLIKRMARSEQIGEIQARLLEIGRRNPEQLEEAAYLANSLTEDGDELVTTFVENQLPSGERK